MDGQDKHKRVFKGLGDLLRIASELAESVRDENATVEVRRSGSSGIPKTLHAVYGVSVRVGPRGAPIVLPFGNIRQNARNEAVIDDAREPITDVLDEGDHYLIVVELPGVGESSVEWGVRNDRLVVIYARTTGRNYSKKIQLPLPVDERTAVSCYENGILELKLWKR